jgi:hypothetical protein
MGTVVLAGATSGSTTLTPTDAVTATITLPSATCTLAGVGVNVGSQITNYISGDIALANTALYYDGPSVSQGTSGTWFVSGTVVINVTGAAAGIYFKLWDGTTLINSTYLTAPGGNYSTPVSLSGFMASPAGNLRISVRNVSNTSGSIIANLSTLSRDSNITAFRIG